MSALEKGRRMGNGNEYTVIQVSLKGFVQVKYITVDFDLDRRERPTLSGLIYLENKML